MLLGDELRDDRQHMQGRGWDAYDRMDNEPASFCVVAFVLGANSFCNI
jgi:hypothetical protein